MATRRRATFVCDLALVAPEAAAVDVLARFQLCAKRAGREICWQGASLELLELIDFMGLSEALPQGSKEVVMAGNGSRQIYVNLAVKELDRSVDFFSKLGFSFDPRFTDETATCMVVGDDAFVMLLVEDRFKDFTKKELADPRAQTEAIIAFSADSREQVDELADKALESGGSAASDPVEMDFMYSRSFSDPDGHHWELVWMDPSAVESQSA